MKSQLIYIVLSIIAGGGLSRQAGLKVQLGKPVSQSAFAAFAIFLVASLGLLIYLFIIKFAFSLVANDTLVSAVVCIAGLSGAFYVAAIVLTPKLGTVLTFFIGSCMANVYFIRTRSLRFNKRASKVC
nr:DMT family transporter [uncultured Flavobacterium sp.]